MGWKSEVSAFAKIDGRCELWSGSGARQSEATTQLRVAYGLWPLSIRYGDSEGTTWAGRGELRLQLSGAARPESDVSCCAFSPWAEMPSAKRRIERPSEATAKPGKSEAAGRDSLSLDRGARHAAVGLWR